MFLRSLFWKTWICGFRKVFKNNFNSQKDESCRLDDPQNLVLTGVGIMRHRNTILSRYCDMLSVAGWDIAIYFLTFSPFPTANHHISISDFALASGLKRRLIFKSCTQKFELYFQQELRIYVMKYRYLVSLNSYNITTQNIVIFYCIDFFPHPLFLRVRSPSHTSDFSVRVSNEQVCCTGGSCGCSSDVWAAAARRRHRSDLSRTARRSDRQVLQNSQPLLRIITT